MKNNVVIDVRNVSKSFGSNKVLDDITFQVEQADKYVILGKSGTGKSVLLKIMLGLLHANNGNVILNGHDISNKSLDDIMKIDLSIGMLFQFSALFDSLTVKDNVLFSLLYKNHNYNKQKLLDIAVENLEHVGLTADILDKSPASLSGGMQKRVALARLLVMKPKILFFDEPTSGLDPVTSMSIAKLINYTTNYLQATSVIITHDMKVVDLIANKVMLLNGSKIGFFGSISDFQKTDNTIVRNFVNGEQ